jgi:hypothetical protein
VRTLSPRAAAANCGDSKIQASRAEPFQIEVISSLNARELELTDAGICRRWQTRRMQRIVSAHGFKCLVLSAGGDAEIVESISKHAALASEQRPQHST